ncbi:MAG: LPS assembly lipoprotein LptE [Rhodospirillales bacterium]|nr:LPS assembly lipoprotein LptE [Rhodospirillales bacterium]
MIRLCHSGCWILIAVMLAGCGYAPVYSGGPGAKVKRDLSVVAIGPIRDRVGQRLRNHLFDLINPHGRPAKPEFDLSVDLEESKQELAVRKTEIATRANLSLTVKFTLTRRGQKRNLLTGQSVSVTSYDILTSEFATLAAEKNARERAVRELSIYIANRLAVFLRPAGAPAR